MLGLTSQNRRTRPGKGYRKHLIHFSPQHCPDKPSFENPMLVVDLPNTTNRREHAPMIAQTHKHMHPFGVHWMFSQSRMNNLALSHEFRIGMSSRSSRVYNSEEYRAHPKEQVKDRLCCICSRSVMLPFFSDVERNWLTGASSREIRFIYTHIMLGHRHCRLHFPCLCIVHSILYYLSELHTLCCGPLDMAQVW